MQEIADVRDGTHDTPQKQEIGKPLITSRQLKNGSILSTDYFITDDDFELVNKRSKVDKNDVLISMIGTIGDTVFIKDEPDFAIKNIGLIKNKDSVTGRFIFYWLNSPAGKHEIDKRLRGTSQRFISLGSLRELEIDLPDYPTQKQITDVLSTYDDLIENNARRIEILEQLAQATHTEWFVNFRFPGHEKIKMVYSGTDFGKIPEGWMVKKIEDVCIRIQAGGTPRRGKSEYWDNGTINWYTTGELQDNFLFGSKEKITEQSIDETSAKIFDKGTILMAIYGSPTVGRLGITTERSSCNQAALGLIEDSKKITKTYLYYVLRNLREKFNLEAVGGGSTKYK